MTDEKHKEAAALLSDGLRQVEVADELGVSPRTVRRWKKQGKLNGVESPDSEQDRPDAPESDGAGGRPKANGATGKPPTLSASRARKEAALAEKHEQDAAVRRGELMERTAHRHTLYVVRRAIKGAPRTVLQEVAELMDVPPREALPILEEISETIRERVHAEVEGWIQEEAPDEFGN